MTGSDLVPIVGLWRDNQIRNRVLPVASGCCLPVNREYVSANIGRTVEMAAQHRISWRRTWVQLVSAVTVGQWLSALVAFGDEFT